MISSMTAFARKEIQDPLGVMSWEIKSVNQRYLDIHMRLPEELRVIEPQIREMIGRHLKRGKVECFLRFQAAPAADADFSINEELAKQLAHASRHIDSVLYNPSPVSSIEILKWPGILQTNKVDTEQLKTLALDLLKESLEELCENRQREGASLQQMIEQRCSAMQETVNTIRERMPAVREGFKTRLYDRLAELKEQVDEGRLEQEVVMLVQKSDIDEELDRLETHINEVSHIFKKGGACGRRLDFLMQEFNRESNTIASKSTDQEVTRAALELKVLIEQAREQIQNIE